MTLGGQTLDRDSDHLHRRGRAELHDLAGCVQGLCSADLGAMATPAGVTPGTPLGDMFVWEEERLTRATKWRGDPGSAKQLAAKVAKVILSLREV